MADQWEVGVLGAINKKRAEMGLPALEWSVQLESEARGYWDDPTSAPNVVKTCNCPHWTPPKGICDLLWCEELAFFPARQAAVVIFNDHLTHAALALELEES